MCVVVIIIVHYVTTSICSHCKVDSMYTSLALDVHSYD